MDQPCVTLRTQKDRAVVSLGTMTTKTNQIKPIRMSDIEEDARKAGVPASVRESEQPQQ